MPDCTIGDAATSGLGGSPARDRRPPAAEAAMREARAAAAIAAAAVDGVEEDEADASAMGSTLRALRGGVHPREDAESTPDLVLAEEMAAGGIR